MVKTISFTSGGKPLVVSIDMPDRQAVSYTLTLFEAKSNSVVVREEGNNVNNEEDVYTLPTPALTNKGRLLELDVTFVDPAGNTGMICTATATVSQGASELGTLSVSGTLTGQSLSGTDFAKLVC